MGRTRDSAPRGAYVPLRAARPLAKNAGNAASSRADHNEWPKDKRPFVCRGAPYNSWRSRQMKDRCFSGNEPPRRTQLI